MVIRQFEGTQHVPQLSDLSIITCEYGHQDIETIIIDRSFDFQKEHRSTIDYLTCPGDDFEWSSADFRDWRATRDPCFIIDLSVLDPLDPRLPNDILKDYTLEFEVRVESPLKDLRECLTETVRDRDYCKEILDNTKEDFDEMGKTYEAELATL